MVLNFSTKRDVRNYKQIDDIEFSKAWARLDISPLETDEEKKEDHPPENTNDYFDTGLNLSKVFGKSQRQNTHSMPPAHSPAHTISSAPAAATAPSQEKPALPKYGFVAMLQEVFGVSDLLENNRFLNKSVADKVSLRHKRKKRVSFAKTEIHEKHLPPCRKNSFQKGQFGHLHSPQCRNYVSEQSLGNQEFLIRGEFIESNVIVPDSEQDFFSVPEMILEPPVRQIPSLSSSLSDSSGSPNLQLDLKGSCLDSINYHDKCSPNMRCLPSPASTLSESAAYSSSHEDSLLPGSCPAGTPFPRVELSFGSPLSTTGSPSSDAAAADSKCSSTSRSKEMEFAPPSQQKVRPMPCQPVFTDADIVSKPLFKKQEVVEVPLIEIISSPVAKIKTESEESEQSCGTSFDAPYLRLPPMTEPPLRGLAPTNPKKRTVSSTSSDSGLGSLNSNPSDFVDDFIDNLSSDSESENDEDATDDITKESDVINNDIKKDSDVDDDTNCDSDTTLCEGSSVTNSLCSSFSVECSIDSDEEDKNSETEAISSQEDSGFNSLSDDEEEDIGELIKRTSIKRPAVQPKMWFIPVSGKKDVEVDGTAPTPETSRLKISDTKQSESSSEDGPLVTDGYVNPFNKKHSDSVSLKSAPSVLGLMICDTKVTRTEERHPEPLQDMFLFDTPSPDDVIRNRQRHVVS